MVSLSKPGCKCHGVSGSCSLKTCWHQLPSFRMIGHELKAKYDSSAVMVKFNKAGTNLIHSYSERKRVVLSEEALRKVSAIKSFKKYPKNPSEFTSSNDVINGNGTDQKNVQTKEYSNSPGEDLKKTHDEPSVVRGSIAIKRRVYRQFGKQRKRHPQKQTESSKRLVVTVRRPSKDELVFTSQSTNFCEPSPDDSWPGTRGRQCKRGSSEPDGCDLMCCGRGYNTFRTRSIERCNCQFIWCCHVQCSSCEKFTDVHVCK